MHRAVAAVLVIVSAAAVLVLELLSVRLAAPYVGVTHETYTAAIGVALAAIAVGAALGGRAADAHEGRLLIGWLFVAGGAFTLLARPLVLALGPALRGAGPLAAVLLVGLAIAVPAAVLSAIPPVVVKLQLASLAETGSVVGWFSALGTFGALAGTFVTGYVLLYALPVSVALAVTGILLVAFGGWQLLTRVLRERRRLPPGSGKRGTRLGAVTLVGFGLLVAVPSDCAVETPYYCARVVDDPERSTGRLLMLDDLPHAYVDAEDPTHLGFAYTRRFADVIDAAYPDGQPLRALHVGGGGFTMPRWLAATRPGSRHTVLELDRHVVELASAEFGVPAATRVRTGDARTRIEQERADAYDVVVGDAFSSRSVPWHLATREFHEEIRRVLRPGGVYVLNVIDHQPFDLLAAVIATVRDVFGEVEVLTDRPNLVDGGNFVLAAGAGLPDRDALADRVAADPVDAVVATRERVDALAGDAAVLTDDWAPVEQLLSVR